MATGRMLKIAAITIASLALAFFCCALAWADTDDATQTNVPASSSMNLEELSNKDFINGRVAVMTGSIQEQQLREVLPSNQIQLYKSNTDAAVAVSTAKADFSVITEPVAKKLAAEYSNLVLARYTEYMGAVAFAMAKGGAQTQLYKEINEYITVLKADGTLQTIYDIWFGDDEAVKTMDDPESLPATNGTIRVVTRSDNEPFEYMKDGKFVGYELDIITRFAKLYGYGIELTTTEFDSLILSVTSNKADIIVGCLNITDERKQSVDFCEPTSTISYCYLYNSTFFDGGSTAPAEDNGSILSSLKKTFVTENRWQLLLGGLGVTLLITIGAAILGTAIGFGFALVRRYCGRKPNKLIDIYVRIFQGTPVLVMLLIFYYIVFGNANVSAVLVAIIVFGLNSAAFISENLSSCLAAVDPGQREAALASGYTERQAFLYFVLPVAVRHMLPVYRGELTGLLKGTSIVGYIALIDLTKAGDIIRSRTYEALFPLITVAIIYLLMARAISIILRIVEKKLLGTRPKTSIKGVTLQ